MSDLEVSPQQLSFDLPVREALGREDFFVSPANAAAVAMIEGWQGWPGGKLLLIGARGAGKTHLAHVWAGLAKAKIIAATDLPGADIATLAQGAIAVEDIDRIAGQADAEEALFHLHNLVLAEGHALLLTSRREPHLWSLALPDLASRMQGTPAVTLGPPDDTLLSAVLIKLMADRQLTPTAGTITYLLKRMERSFEAAHEVVSRLDRMSLETGAPITRDLARKLLDKPNP
jgi:chromosomal replication initiation ATPase DnaA